MYYGLLADVIVAIHFAIVFFVVVGEAMVLVGGPLGWRWVRSLAFRLGHLGTTLFVAVEGAFNVFCPLTTWEHDLRERAGETVEEASFVGRLLHEALFVEVPQDVLNKSYVVFGALVVLSWLLFPPRRRRSERNDAASSRDPGPPG